MKKWTPVQYFKRDRDPVPPVLPPTHSLSKLEDIKCFPCGFAWNGIEPVPEEAMSGEAGLAIGAVTFACPQCGARLLVERKGNGVTAARLPI